jgi:serine/threonine protein kinase/tetratricopeptide (TPR) repeat protein
MARSFQLDKYHINNLQGEDLLGSRYSGFGLETQQPVTCLLLEEAALTPEQIAELQRITLILAQKAHEGVLPPLAWGAYEGRHYVIYPDLGRPLSSYGNLKPLTPGEVLGILRRLLKALCFAESKGIEAHGAIHTDFIRVDLASSDVELSLFGYPLLAVVQRFASLPEAQRLAAYLPPVELTGTGLPLVQCDLYALGLIALELATAQSAAEALPEELRLSGGEVRKAIAARDNLPLPVQELIFKLLNPQATERYSGYQQALEDVVKLVGEEENKLSFQTFILDTLINGRFKLGQEIAQSELARVYKATDLRGEGEEGEGITRDCIIKLIDLRAHPELAQVFQTRFKALPNVFHEHLLQVYDVGVHFENGYIAMEPAALSLEALLIKRGTLPLPDAGRVIFQLCKALEGLDYHHIPSHGVIKPSNVFLSSDLRTIKLGDAVTAQFFLEHGNLNYVGAEYFTPEGIRQQPLTVQSDIYCLGTLFYEMLVGHPPFSFKIEQEIIEDQLNVPAATHVEASLIIPELKAMILRMLEKNPALRYPTVEELKNELGHLLGYDKVEKVEIPNLVFDFAELSMIGKNAREKGEEALTIRLPTLNNRGRGALALLVGHGKAQGDATKAAQSALAAIREMLFNPGSVSPDFARQQKADPEAFLTELCDRLNQRLYREAFALGKTRQYGVSAAVGIVQENTLYLQSLGAVQFHLLAQGEMLDVTQDKWCIVDEQTLGDAAHALSPEVHDRLGFGEMVKIQRLKRRLKDGDQLVMLSPSIVKGMSISEIRELITSAGEPAQAIDLIRSDAMRRRLEGAISCVLLNIGHTVVFADEGVSHAKKGMLARNFLGQGDAYLNEGKVEEAIEQYNLALEINPNFAIIHHQLGVAYLRRGLASYALSCFDRALTLNDKLPASYLEMANILRQQRRQREVLPLLRKAYAAGCRDADLLAELGHELIGVRSFDEAVVYLTEALNQDPAHPTAFRDRSLALRRRKALDTQLLKMFTAPRPRLSEDGRTRLTQQAPDVDEDEQQ